MNNIDINMFKELELQCEGVSESLKEAEKLCDAIYKKVKTLRFSHKAERNITGMNITGMYTKGIHYSLTDEGKISILSHNGYINKRIWSHNGYINKRIWKKLCPTIKIQLIKTLPNFFNSIIEEHHEMSKEIRNFMSQFKDINLSNTWK